MVKNIKQIRSKLFLFEISQEQWPEALKTIQNFILATLTTETFLSEQTKKNRKTYCQINF